VCFGDGVYDASFSRNGIIYMLDEHIDRFYSSAAKVDIKIDMLKPELAALLKSLLKQVEPDDEYLVYWQASRGTAMRAHSYPDDMKANLMVMISPHRYNPCIEPVKLIT